MAKHIECVVPGCKFEASAPTEAELMTKVASHAANAHGLTHIPPHLATQVKAAITDKPEPA